MRLFLKKPKLMILTGAAIVMIAVAVVGLHMLVSLYMYGDSEYKIKNLKVVQNRFALDISWKDAGCENYSVMVFSGVGVPYQTTVKSPSCEINHIKIGEDYKVIVTALDEKGLESGASKKTIRTKKLKQTVKLAESEFEGFAKDRYKISAKAHGKITYHSSKSNIAQVSDQGKITMKKSGTATIKVKAKGNKNYRSAWVKVIVKVYPGELDSPTLTLTKTTETTANLKWNQVSLAKEYRLLRYDAASGKYKESQTFSKGETSVELVRDQTKYKIQAVADVNGKEVTSPASKPVQVYSTAKTAETYSSSKTIETLDNSNMEVVTMITGSGSIKVPQSMCFNGEEYIVSYVNKAGTEGAFLAYGRDGEYTRGERASNMGAANGCTYNPNTGKIYVAKTHKSYRTNSCSTYFEKDFSSSEIFNLPKQTSGIAYDESNNKYYLSKGNEIYVCDTDFNVEKFIWKKIRYNHAQDIGAYNGVVLVCTWVSGRTSYIDMYRSTDGEYLGSYYVPVGEIESVIVDDGYFVILMNIQDTNKDYIYRTKERVAIP